jgi:tetratricopeptide (TPR) repeat protein
MGVKGNHLEATEAFKNALKINPNHIPAYLGLGTAYGNTGHHKEAVAIFKQGIQLDPGHRSAPQMQMNIAVMAHHMKNGKVAVQYAKKALQSYTDQGDYAGVALAGQKLKQFATTP